MSVIYSSLALIKVLRYTSKNFHPFKEPYMRTLFLAGLLICTACNNKTKETVPGTLSEDGKSFATVNGKKLPQAAVDALISRIPESQRAKYLEQGIVSQMEDQLIVTEIIYQKAIAANLHKNPENKISLALAQREALVNMYMQIEVEAALTDEKIHSVYTERTVRYQKTEIDISVLPLKNKAKADEVKKQLDNGADFVALVKEYAEDESLKQMGGNIGKRNIAQLPPEMKTLLSKAKDGDVIGPLNDRGKFILIKANAIISSITPFEEVKDALKQELVKEESQKIIDSLKAEAKIEHKSKTEQPDATKDATPKNDTPSKKTHSHDHKGDHTHEHK